MSDETVGRIEQLTEEHDDVPVFDYQDLLIKTAEDIEQENQRLRELLKEARVVIEELQREPREYNDPQTARCFQKDISGQMIRDIEQELEGDSDGD